MPYENEKCIQQKLTKFAQILGILSDNFKPTLVKNKIYIALAFFVPLLEAKFGH